MVAVVGQNWELDGTGSMPWPNVLQARRCWDIIIEGQTLVSGRKTWEMLPKNLQKRKESAIILSQDEQWIKAQPQNVPWRYYLKDEPYENSGKDGALRYALHVARTQNCPHSSGALIIGGASLYQAALEADLVDVLHLLVLRSNARVKRRSDLKFSPLHYEGWLQSGPKRCEQYGHYSRLVRDPSGPALAKGTKHEASADTCIW